MNPVLVVVLSMFCQERSERTWDEKNAFAMCATELRGTVKVGAIFLLNFVRSYVSRTCDDGSFCALDLCCGCVNVPNHEHFTVQS